MKQNKMPQLSIFVVLFMAVVISGWFFNKKKQDSVVNTVAGNYDTVMKHDKYGQNKRAPVDYYTLALSWSPAFCDIQKDRYHGNIPKSLQYQCGGTTQFGWVIHGLWPQNGKARNISDHPRFCQGDLAELPETTIEKYLPEAPGAALLQGEWEKHGACAFSNAEQYFEQQKALFNALKLPKYELSKTELFRWIRQNNPHLNGVYMGATKTELFICYNKQFQPIDCPRNQFQ